MKPKHQRLTLAAAAVAALMLAAALAIPALREEAAYFMTPGDLGAGIEPGRAIRLGGLVEKGSVRRSADGLTLSFSVTDRLATTEVRYTGIVPDLFREGQGVIADGRFDAAGVFRAETLLAKHDETYMSPELARAVADAEAKAKARPEMPAP